MPVSDGISFAELSLQEQRDAGASYVTYVARPTMLQMRPLPSAVVYQQGWLDGRMWLIDHISAVGEHQIAYDSMPLDVWETLEDCLKVAEEGDVGRYFAARLAAARQFMDTHRP